MKTISFISAKGGSGKTMITATMADFLGKLGKRVLIIDADGSTNGMTLFYLKEIRKYAASCEKCLGVLEDSFEVETANYTPLNGYVSLLPATYKFVNTDSFNVNLFEQNLRKITAFYKQNKEGIVDYILIDCQAGVDVRSEVVVKEAISDEVIIVSEYDPISAAGIERLKGLFYKESMHDRSWVLLNKVWPEFANTSSDFLETTRHLPPITWNPEVVLAYARRGLALDFERGNEYTLNMVKLLRVPLGKEIKKPLDEWLNGREEIIKKPIYDEYLKWRKEYDEIQKLEKADLNPLLPILIVLVTVTVFFVLFSFQFGITNNIVFPTFIVFLAASIMYVSTSLYRRRKQMLKRNEFRKKMISGRLEELEKLKHADIEKVLRINRGDCPLSLN